MPTTITGQNGAQIKQNTKIKVTGCPKAKKKAKKPKKRKHDEEEGRGVTRGAWRRCASQERGCGRVPARRWPAA